MGLEGQKGEHGIPGCNGTNGCDGEMGFPGFMGLRGPTGRRGDMGIEGNYSKGSNKSGVTNNHVRTIVQPKMISMWSCQHFQIILYLSLHSHLFPQSLVKFFLHFLGYPTIQKLLSSGLTVTPTIWF